jgi:hypothetical protein
MLHRNRSTALFATVQGVVVGALGAIHGASAALKGYVSTDGFVMTTIGAVTVIPNYLITGLAAIVVGVCILLWTVFFIHSRRGPVVFLALSILLVAVGGGIAHIPFFLIGWAVSTRINSPLTWWKKAIPEGLALRLARAWLAILVVDYALLFVGITIWLVFLPPGSANRSPILQYTCWCLIAAGLLMQLPTIVSGFMRDLQRRVTTNEQ